MNQLMNFLQAASNTAASNVSGPVDLIAEALRAAGVPVPRNALLSSEWMRERGLTAPVRQGASQVAGDTLGLLAPVAAAAKAPQIARGLLQVGKNAAAPRAAGMKTTQRGALDFGPQAEALRTAQRNAAKPVSEGGLGLPPNNTAADRAKAMGFDREVYHGTTADVPAFDLRYYGSDGVAYDTPSVFASSDARLASDYARNKYSREVSNAMRELEAYKRANPGDYGPAYESAYQKARDLLRTQGHELGYGGNVMPLVMRGNFKPVDAGGKHFTVGIPPELDAAKRAGFDGVDFSNVVDHASPATQYPTNVTTVFDPTRIRSRFAAFDPTRIKDPDLLAGLAAMGLLSPLAFGSDDGQ